MSKTSNEPKIPHVSAMDARAATLIMRQAGLHITPTTLRLGIASGQYPFGTCVLDREGHVLNCTVYRRDLIAWLQSKAD